MFKINRRTDYAVRVMVALAKRPFGTRLATQVIQDEMMIPRAFLQRIVADLSHAALIATYPGPNGGLQLSRPSETIHLLHIWEAIEGALMVSDCLHNCGECPLEKGCPVRSHWGRIQAGILRELEETTLEQLVYEAEQIKLRNRLAQPVTLLSDSVQSLALDA